MRGCHLRWIAWIAWSVGLGVCLEIGHHPRITAQGPRPRVLPNMLKLCLAKIIQFCFLWVLGRIRCGEKERERDREREREREREAEIERERYIERERERETERERTSHFILLFRKVLSNVFFFHTSSMKEQQANKNTNINHRSIASSFK